MFMIFLYSGTGELKFKNFQVDALAVDRDAFKTQRMVFVSAFTIFTRERKAHVLCIWEGVDCPRRYKDTRIQVCMVTRARHTPFG